MESLSSRQIALALFGMGDTESRLKILSQVVIDLLMEVEALRSAFVHLHNGPDGDPVHTGFDFPCTDETLTESTGSYPAAYVNAAFTRHNGAGPTSGIEKLIARF